MSRTCLSICAVLLLGWAAVAPRPVAAEDAEALAVRLLAGLKDPSPDVRAQAALDAVTCPDPSLLSPLVRLAADAESSVRQAAARALATREGKSDRKKAAAALNPRLARLSMKPAQQAELLVVIASLGTLGQSSSIKPLLADITAETATEVAEARLFAVAEIPDREAIERLIQFLSKGRRRSHHNGVAHKALRYATGETLGRDPDAWRAWWRAAEKTFDFEAIARARAEAAAERKAKADRKKERKKGRKDKGGKKDRKDEDAD